MNDRTKQIEQLTREQLSTFSDDASNALEAIVTEYVVAIVERVTGNISYNGYAENALTELFDNIDAALSDACLADGLSTEYYESAQADLLRLRRRMMANADPKKGEQDT